MILFYFLSYQNSDLIVSSSRNQLVENDVGFFYSYA